MDFANCLFLFIEKAPTDGPSTYFPRSALATASRPLLEGTYEHERCNMQTITRLLFVLSVALIPPNGLAFGSVELPKLTSSPLTHLIIEGHVVAKGVLVWEERVSPINEIHLKREYLVLQESLSSDDRIVLEFEPLLISIDQFHIGEKIQAKLAADGSIVSANHVK